MLEAVAAGHGDDTVGLKKDGEGQGLRRARRHLVSWLGWQRACKEAQVFPQRGSPNIAALHVRAVSGVLFGVILGSAAKLAPAYLKRLPCEGSPGFRLPLLTLAVLLRKWKVFTSADGGLLG